MFVNIPNFEELTEEERVRETERLLREIVTAHNRELDDLRAEFGVQSAELKGGSKNG